MILALLRATAVAAVAVAVAVVWLTLSMLRTLLGQQLKQHCRSASVSSMELSELWLYHAKRYCVTAFSYYSVADLYSSMILVTAVAATTVF
jgi:hypothetical protein